MSLQELEEAALKLAPEEQARLLHTLAVALDDAEELEPELTLEELEHRWADFEAGGLPGFPAEEVEAEARKRCGLT